MTALIPFKFNSRPVRAFERDGQAWFVAADVAAVLGYSSTQAMTRSLDADERGVHNLHTPSGEQEMTVINESGLFHAALKSRKPEAKPFRKWVTSEVLPAIRKTGAYDGRVPIRGVGGRAWAASWGSAEPVRLPRRAG